METNSTDNDTLPVVQADEILIVEPNPVEPAVEALQDIQPILNEPQPEPPPIHPSNNDEVVSLISDSEATPVLKKRKKLSPQNTPTSILNKSEDDEEGSMCPVCFDNWEMTGSHRIVSIKCGHLFGESCIRRWLRESINKCCPSCKTKASTRDIRYIYAKRVRALDRSEEYKLQKKLSEEKMRNLDLQKTVGNLKVELALYKQRMMALEEGKSNEFQDFLKDSDFIENVIKHRSYSFAMQKNIEIHRESACRALMYHKRTQRLIISQKATQTLFPGYGVRCMDTNGFHLSYSFLHMSQKEIRDIAMDNDGELIIATSRENSAKLFSIQSNALVSTFTSDKNLWSVAFDPSRPKCLYLGSQNSTFIYDIRNPRTHTHVFDTVGDYSTVVNINPIPQNVDFPFGGFIVCKLQSLWFYEYTASQEIVPHKLEVNGPFNASKYDEYSKHLLISARPTARDMSTRHIVAVLVKIEQIVVLRIVTTIIGSTKQVMMCRSASLMKFNNDIIVAAYSQDSKHLVTWNATSNLKMQMLPIRDTVLDTCPIYVNHRSYLSALSETRLRVYAVMHT